MLRKLFILILVVAALHTAWRFDEVREPVQAWIDNLIEDTLDKAKENTQNSTRFNQQNLKQMIGDDWPGFSQAESNFVNQMLATQSGVNAFQQDFCQTERHHGILTKQHLQQVCSKMNQVKKRF